MLAQNAQGQLQGPRLSAGVGQNFQMGYGMNQPHFGLQSQNSQQTFMPLSAQLPFPGVGQYKGQMHPQFSIPLQGVNQGQLPQHLINYQQQPFVVQNLIQPQPQIQYQQQVVQHPPLQITQPAQIERKVNYIPQKKQIVKMEEQEIEELVPVERTIIEYIPVQTIIEKVLQSYLLYSKFIILIQNRYTMTIPVPVEIPYEVMIPKPYQQEIKYPNLQNQFLTDDMGNPLSNPQDLFKNKIPPTQITSYQYKNSESDDEDDDDKTDDDDDELIEKYTRIIEEIKQRRRRRRHKQGLSSADEDDFNFSKFQSKFGSPYENQGGFYGDRYDYGDGGSRYNQIFFLVIIIIDHEEQRISWQRQKRQRLFKLKKMKIICHLNIINYLMELDFLSPRAREINKKKLSLLYSLKNQNIEQNDLINENVSFIKKLTSDHPLNDVIKECQNNVREGFLTPLTNRSSISVEFTANMFVEEILDSIKIKHLKVIQLDELINNFKNNIEIIQKIEVKQQSSNLKELYEILILNQPNDDNYQLYLNDQKLYPQQWHSCPFDAKHKLNFALFSNNNKMLEAISVDMIYQIGNNSANIKPNEYHQILQIRFLEESNNPILYELQIQLFFNMTNDLKKKIIKTLKEEIQEIDSKILDMIEVINRMLEPFSNNGFKYLRYEGLIDNQSMSRNRNHCCNIF